MSLSAEDRCRIGGSDVAALVGVSPYAGPLSVYLRVVEGVEQEAGPHAARGNRLEGPVLDWYAEEQGRQLQRRVALRDPARPYLRASVDALAWWYGRECGPARVVEAKTANASAAHRWGEEGTDAIPEEYLCQVQWYMGLGRATGYAPDDVADVPALVAGDFRLYRVQHDAETFGMLLEAVERFWTDHVLAKSPPEPTVRLDAEAIARRFHRHVGENHVDFSALSPEAQVILEEYLRLYGDASAAADRLALWEARAKMVLGDAPGVRGLPESTGYHRLDWRAHKGRKYTDWAAVQRALSEEDPGFAQRMRALIEAHTTTRDGARPFVPRPLLMRRT